MIESAWWWWWWWWWQIHDDVQREHDKLFGKKKTKVSSIIHFVFPLFTYYYPPLFLPISLALSQYSHPLLTSGDC